MVEGFGAACVDAEAHILQDPRTKAVGMILLPLPDLGKSQARGIMYVCVYMCIHGGWAT
jgi:hypothetical protein